MFYSKQLASIRSSIQQYLIAILNQGIYSWLIYIIYSA